MIVSSQQDGIVMVKQVDHARLAGDFARHWGNSVFSSLAEPDRVTLATDQHDLGWKEPDEEVLFDASRGKPLQFNAIDFKQHVGFYRQGVDHVFTEDTYAGLLVAMHWIGLYTGRFGYLTQQPGPRFTDDTGPMMLEDLMVEQQRHWAELRLKLWKRDRPLSDFERQIWTHYELLQYFDRLSLFACMNDLSQQATTNLAPVPVESEKRANVAVRAAGGNVIELDPYPFCEDRVELSVQMKKVPDRSYVSHEELVKATAAAREEEIVFQLRPAN